MNIQGLSARHKAGFKDLWSVCVCVAGGGLCLSHILCYWCLYKWTKKMNQKNGIAFLQQEIPLKSPVKLYNKRNLGFLKRIFEFLKWKTHMSALVPDHLCFLSARVVQGIWHHTLIDWEHVPYSQYCKVCWQGTKHYPNKYHHSLSNQSVWEYRGGLEASPTR